jgi:two-component system response regulator HupR/HoxA
VLLVDDDKALLETTAALLETEFNVHTAANGEAALRFLDTLPVDVLCTDFKMPNMDGIELLRKAAVSHPQLKGILMTGFREQLPKGTSSDGAVFGLVYKPYEPDSLISMVHDAAKVGRMNQAMTSFARNTSRLGGSRS